MAQIIVRHIENDLKEALKQNARRHGLSMEEEVRQILRRAVNEETAKLSGLGLGSRIVGRFADVGLNAPLPEWHGQTIEPVGFAVGSLSIPTCSRR